VFQLSEELKLISHDIISKTPKARAGRGCKLGDPLPLQALGRDFQCNIVAGVLPLWNLTPPMRFGRASPLCSSIRMRCPSAPPTSPLHAPAPSHSFCHPPFLRGPHRHCPGNPSASLARPAVPSSVSPSPLLYTEPNPLGRAAHPL
jgi:hypothetical protein